MKTTHSILVALCTLLAFSITKTQATTVIPPTFDELVAQAQVIFQGTVTEVKSQWTGEGAQRHIVTYVTFQVDDSLKGEPGSNYTMRMLGGTVDGQTMEVTDSPKFKVGDRDIVFVENNGTQFIPLVGIMHGRFRVKKDEQTGADVVLGDHGQTVSDLAQLGKEDIHKHAHHSAANATAADAASDTAKTLRTADFKAAIKAKLGSDSR